MMRDSASGSTRASRSARSIGARSRASSGSLRSSNCSRPSVHSTGLPSCTTAMVAAVLRAQRALGQLGLAAQRADDRRARGRRRQAGRAPGPAMKAATIASTKSSPPSQLSPAVARTSMTPSKRCSSDTSKVPPPRSTTRNSSSSSCAVEAVGQRRRGRLGEQPLDLEAGELARRLGGLALHVVEIGRHGDHRLGRPARPGRLRRRPSASAAPAPKAPPAG